MASACRLRVVLRTLGFPACAAVGLLLALANSAIGWQAADSASDDYLSFVKAQAVALRGADRPPADATEWRERRQALRDALQRSWGEVPQDPAPLEPRIHGTLPRAGYRLEKISFQTLPGIRMLANAYVPDRPGPLPAVLCVHGHWPRAKQDPVVQARCIGLAKLGFFVLVVDAFGAGERAIGKALGEYHGAMAGALLFPIGRPLAGIQVYENHRAVDYLLTRPEVDGRRIGVTGASGGGNQSMYAGAFDERIAAAVPVCSVGNYHAYLGAACCMCEVVPGALRFTDEGDLLGLTAPRGLMVINATHDAPQFSVAEARKSLERASRIFELVDKPQHVRHTIIESGHDYNQAMREAMYGWMTWVLKGEGNGQPITEPEIKTEDPEVLRCYPGESRPDDYLTLPKFASREARRLIAGRPAATKPDERVIGRRKLAAVLGTDRAIAAPLDLKVTNEADSRQLVYVSEPGIRLVAQGLARQPKPRRLALVLDWSGSAAAADSAPARALREDGWNVVTFDLRATGKQAVPRDSIGDAPDHNSAEWGLWIGRPLLGQWVHDVRRTLDAIEAADGGLPPDTLLVGSGPAGIVALAAAALDDRIRRTICVETLASYVSPVPYRRQVLGIMVPGLLREVGDVAHLTGLASDRPVIHVASVGGDGERWPAADVRALFIEQENVQAYPEWRSP